MFCPNCGKDCGDTGFCSVCDQALDSFEEEVPNPPIGRYHGVDGYIDISFCTLEIHKEGVAGVTEQITPYENIVGVWFQKASEEKLGYLAIRDKRDVTHPVETLEDAACDKSALLFETGGNSIFKGINAFLKQVSEKQSGESIIAGELFGKRGQIHCPRCGSEECNLYKETVYFPAACWSDSWCRLIASILNLYWKMFRKGRVYTCCNCNYRWIP